MNEDKEKERCGQTAEHTVSADQGSLQTMTIFLELFFLFPSFHVSLVHVAGHSDDIPRRGLACVRNPY